MHCTKCGFEGPYDHGYPFFPNATALEVTHIVAFKALVCATHRNATDTKEALDLTNEYLSTIAKHLRGVRDSLPWRAVEVPAPPDHSQILAEKFGAEFRLERPGPKYLIVRVCGDCGAVVPTGFLERHARRCK